jgi:hypothetical protein
VLLRGQPFEEAARAAGQGGDPPTVGMDIMQSAEGLAVERLDLRIA